MKPDRPSPPGPPVPYARLPPPEDHRPPSMIASGHPPTLPSIHHLHPELASTSSMTHPMPSSSTHPQANYFTSDSMRDYEGDPPGPPKKKRRRQALSCTECKRRKIKCDRAQPCGPCSRRGEQSKCQWNIIEPMEKYVTRTEYDDLKTRVEYLEDIIARIPNTSYDLRNPPSPPLSTHGYRPPTASGRTYPPHLASTSALHRDMPSSYSPIRGEPPPLSNPVHHGTAPPESPPYPPSTVSAYPDHSGRSNVSISSSNPATARALSNSPILSSSSRLRETGSTSRPRGLSLADITTPHIPEGGSTPSVGASYPQQPKNRQAQMPTPLGQHLRKVSAPTGPVTETLRQARNITATTTRRTSIWAKPNYQQACEGPPERRRQREALHRVAPLRPRNRRVVVRRHQRRLRQHNLRQWQQAPRDQHLLLREVLPLGVIGCLDICPGIHNASDSYPFSHHRQRLSELYLR
ncbi:hypothetical protein BDY19DRAFT_989309 [Irpex rosettiformis]|uniref:Uncharacterized protein n=1 Tax=Irpex rosettiformis TaxID=378272 RepID=A0ACB8UHK3_9APHY|nr:hypothetical protein BDY19DRAFT_989309 [Irpex rosettiformis]